MLTIPLPVTRIFNNGWPGPSWTKPLALEDYSVSNRGLRSGLVGTPESVAERVAAFEALELICSCSSAVPNTRSWNDFLRPSFSPAPQPQRRWKQKPLPSEVERQSKAHRHDQD